KLESEIAFCRIGGLSSHYRSPLRSGTSLELTGVLMPPRILVALILAFWVVSTGWLFYREWWRWLGAESPPPINTELADEAISQSARWRIWRGNKEKDIGHASTTMKFLKNSTVELESTIDRLAIEARLGALTVPLVVQKLVTTQRLTPEGQLLFLESE